MLLITFTHSRVHLYAHDNRLWVNLISLGEALHYKQPFTSILSIMASHRQLFSHGPDDTIQDAGRIVALSIQFAIRVLQYSRASQSGDIIGWLGTLPKNSNDLVKFCAEHASAASIQPESIGVIS